MPRQRFTSEEERDKHKAVRIQAMNYAKQFLVQKYKSEYHELYSAYLQNRGLSSEVDKKLVDERQVNA
jgi:hypothetical protein